MICPRCSANVTHGNFCGGCGAPLPAAPPGSAAAPNLSTANQAAPSQSPPPDASTIDRAPKPPHRKRNRIIAIALILVAALVVGAFLGVKKWNEAKEYAADNPRTCADYLALDAKHARDAYRSTGRIFTYTPEGATARWPSEIFKEQCPGLPPETRLSGLVDSGDVEGPYCQEFTGLSADVQATWLEVLDIERTDMIGTGLEGVTAADIEQGCVDFAAVSQYILQTVGYVDSFKPYMTWTTQSHLGYSQPMILGASPPMTGADVVHPHSGGSDPITGEAYPEFRPSACGFDPDRDAAVPLYMKIVNLSDGYTSDLSSRFELRVDGNADLTTTAYLEADYEDGGFCSEAALTGQPAFLSSHFIEPQESSASTTYFVILKDYKSPNYPGGARGELSSYTLVSSAPDDSDDPIEETSHAELNLSKVLG